MSTAIANSTKVATPLDIARDKLYQITGGRRDSGDPKAASITTQQRMDYFRSAEFRAWVASEKAAGREIFWLKDVDKTQGSGDVFTFFYKWRSDLGKFSTQQRKVIYDFMLSQQKSSAGPAKSRRKGSKTKTRKPAAWRFAPQSVIDSWLSKEAGGEGIGMLDFWSGAYWPSQFGLSKEEKIKQVEAFAPSYAARVYPGVKEENQLLEELGIHVVIVSNGDQELAIAIAPHLGVKPENVVGSHLIYDENGISTGVNHTYEVTGGDWHSKPQPGKPLSFHYWQHMNRARFGWDSIDEERFVIAGRDGDSASSDGGMMILAGPPAIGNFMVNTPGEPNRIAAFHALAQKYGNTRGQFITLNQLPSQLGFKP